MKLEKVTGDEIVALLGVSESDDRMLDLFEKLGVDKDKFERDEDDSGLAWIYADLGSFGIEFEDDTHSSIYSMGLSLYKDPTKISPEVLKPFKR